MRVNRDHHRQSFLTTVRRALQNHRAGSPAAGAPSAPPSAAAPPKDPHAILEVLAASAAEFNMALSLASDHAAAATRIAEIVRDTAPEWEGQDAVTIWDHPLLAHLGLPEILERVGVPCHPIRSEPGRPLTEDDRDRFRTRLVNSKIGITAADYGIAETATLVLRSRSGQPGAVSLVPSVHLAVITASQVLPDFVSFYDRMEAQLAKDPEALTHRMTLISGPSKTGDIELVMVPGAHGPRALHLVVIDDLT